MVEINEIYRHFKKGDRYKVLLLAKDSETQENMVIYQALYGDNLIWTRKLSIFEEILPEGIQSFNNQKYRFQKDYMTWWELEGIAP
jgi:hypothetical protein